VIEHRLHRTLTLLHRVVLRDDPHPPHRRKRHQTRVPTASSFGSRPSATIKLTHYF
jgi:hypothetical protein